MATIDELKSGQEAAGLAYAAAALAYRDAWRELHAYDQALSNANIPVDGQPTFSGYPTLLRHPRFLPQADQLNGPLADEAKDARIDELVRSYTAEG